MFMEKNRKRIVFIAAALIYFMLYAAAFAEKHDDDCKTLRYRGKRLPSAVELFYVTKIESEIESGNYLEIEIKFNIPVEPRTLQKKFIRINGNPLLDAAVLSFNKAGNKIKILIPVSVVLGSEKDEPFYIDLPEAKSFNHIPLYSSHFDDIHCNKEYRFEFVNIHPHKDKEKHGKITHNHYSEYIRFEEDD